MPIKPFLGLLIPLKNPQASRALGGEINYPFINNDYIATQQYVAKEIVEKAKLNMLISPEDADRMEDKIFTGANVVHDDFRKEIELLAQKVDLQCIILPKAANVFKTNPEAKPEINKKISACNSALAQGHIDESTDLLLDLNIQLGFLKEQQKKYEIALNNIKSKKIAPPSPEEKDVSDINNEHKNPEDDPSPIAPGLDPVPTPLGMKQLKPNPIQGLNPPKDAPSPPKE